MNIDAIITIAAAKVRRMKDVISKMRIVFAGKQSLFDLHQKKVSTKIWVLLPSAEQKYVRGMIDDAKRL